MDLVLKVDDNVGALAAAIGKMIADVKKITGVDNGGVSGEVLGLLAAAAQDLAPVVGGAMASKEAIKADRIKFALALLVEVEKALEL